MDLILLFCFINFLLLVYLLVRFFRFTRTVLSDQDSLLVRMKKQGERLDKTAEKQEDTLEHGLVQSRKHMLSEFNEQLDKDVKRIGKELDDRLEEYTASLFSRADEQLAEAVKQSEQTILEHRKATIADFDREVRERINKTVKTGIARGVSVSVHEDIVTRAIQEAANEING